MERGPPPGEDLGSGGNGVGRAHGEAWRLRSPRFAPAVAAASSRLDIQAAHGPDPRKPARRAPVPMLRVDPPRAFGLEGEVALKRPWRRVPAEGTRSELPAANPSKSKCPPPVPTALGGGCRRRQAAVFIHRLGEGSRLVVDAHRRGPSGRLVAALAAALAVLGGFAPGLAHADESRIILPDFSSVNFLFGLIDGHTLLLFGMFISLVIVFGTACTAIRDLPHCSMREISELIYETARLTLTQIKFILLLEVLSARSSRVLRYCVDPRRARCSHLLFSLVGIAGAAASRGSAFASTPSPTRARRSPPSKGSRSRPTRFRSRRHEHRHGADQHRAAHHAGDSAVHSADERGPLLHRLCDRRVARRFGPASPAASSRRSPTSART